MKTARLSFPLAVVLAATCAIAWGEVASDVVLDLRFEEAQANGVKDNGPAGLGVEVVGTPASVPGKRGKAMRFAGADYLEIAPSGAVSLRDSFTIELWVRPAAEGSPRLVDKSTAGQNDGYLLDLHPNNHPRVITSALTLYSPDPIPVGQWSHVGAVYDAEAGYLALYVNGRVVVEGEFSPGTMPTANSNPLRIGADSDRGSRFHGDLDEIVIYRRALSEEEMAVRAGVEPPESIIPVAHWKDDQAQVDVAGLVARNDVVYLSPATDRPEGLPLGNGQLGAMVWNEDLLNVQLNHGSLWRGFQAVSSGRVHLKTAPDLNDDLVQFDERLALYDGTMRMAAQCKSGPVDARCFVAEGSDVMVIHVRDGRSGTRTYRLDLEFWREASVRQVDGDVLVVGEDCLDAESPYEYGDAIAVAADGARVEAHGGPEGQLWLEWSLDSAGEFTVYVSAAVRRGKKEPPVDAARAALAEARRQGPEALEEKVQAYWHAFWPKSFVYLTSRDGSADYLENLWYLHLYWTAASSRGEYVPKFNGGNWLCHRDHRGWGGSYWYQNTREQYWPVLAADHAELAEPFYELYWRTLPKHREHAQKLFGKGGAQVQETMRLDGEGDKSGNPYTCLYLTTGTECALQFYRHYEYSRDETFLRERAYPLLKAMIQFYLEYVTKEADGRWHIYPTSGRETYWHVKDAQTDICAILTGTKILLRESERLGVDADLRPKWQDLHDNLAPLPVDRENDIYAPAVFLDQWPEHGYEVVKAAYPPERRSTSIKKRFNSENVECDLIYPWGLAGIGSENCELATRTFFNRQFKGGGGWQPAPIWAARLGLGSAAAAALMEHARACQLWSQGFYNSPSAILWGTYQYGEPYFDASGVPATALGEMMLQCHTGLIRIFPAWPRRWDGLFRLRARTGFMVTAQCAGHKVLLASVESLRGAECRIANPWPDKAFVRRGDTLVLESDESVLAFPTEPGGIYLIERAAAPLASLRAERLAPEPNPGPKFPGYKLIDANAYCETGGRSFIGVSAEGLNPVRHTIRKTREQTAARLAEKIAGRPNLAAAKAGAVAYVVDEAGKTRLEPRLNDGLVGEANSVELRPARTVRIDLGRSAMVDGLVWSVDRQCRWTPRHASRWEYEIQVSDNARTWSGVHKGSNSQAITWGIFDSFKATPARYVQLIVGPGASLDEIEVYPAAEALP